MGEVRTMMAAMITETVDSPTEALLGATYFSLTGDPSYDLSHRELALLQHCTFRTKSPRQWAFKIQSLKSPLSHRKIDIQNQPRKDTSTHQKWFRDKILKKCT